MKVVVVVPVFNEAATIGHVVAAARAHAPVLVVDDGSTDGSGEAAAVAGAEVLRHRRRLGKGQALRAGIAAARRMGAAYVATLDGDGQHDARDLPWLLAAAGPGRVVVGGRVDHGDGAQVPAGRLAAVRVAGFFLDWATGLCVHDSQSGFRVYPAALFETVRLRRGGFVFETEVLVAAAAHGYTVEEIAVTVIPRASRRSRFRPIADGVAIAAYLAGPVMRRWGRETSAAVREVAALFDRRRLQARHEALLEAGAPYAGSPAWGPVVGGAALQRAAGRAGGWWRHPRCRRAAVAAASTLAGPVVLACAAVQALGGRRAPDVVTPLVHWLYAPGRLDPLDAAARPSAAGVRDGTAAGLPSPEPS
jgi:hypothetical protein